MAGCTVDEMGGCTHRTQVVEKSENERETGNGRMSAAQVPYSAVRLNTPCGSREWDSGDICALSSKHTKEKKSRRNDGKCSAVQQSSGGGPRAGMEECERGQSKQRDSESVHDAVQTLAL